MDAASRARDNDRMADEPEEEYILGTEREELERLRFQHQAWVRQGYELFERAGLRAGQTVLDLGCGPGFTSVELACVVGPSGRVLARDESGRFLAFLRSEADRLGLGQVETSQGRVEDLDLGAETLDAVYARWLLCWLPDALGVLRRLAPALRPGGAFVFQEYLDWGSMKLLPRSEVFDRSVAACMHSWEVGDATIDLAQQAPAFARELGFAPEHFRPRARLGAVGSLEWRWVFGFLSIYLPKLVARGLYGADELEAWRAELERRTAEGTTWLYTPVMADVVLRKPR